MATKYLMGTHINEGDVVYFDDRALVGDVIKKTDQRLFIKWRNGAEVGYPIHTMFEVKEN